MGSFTQLDPKIVEALKLDDYTNQNYSNGSDRVFLYIGYYLTSKKVGAAHDPLVCFPGQGWVISNKTKGKFILNSKTGESISYSSMTVQQGRQKNLIVYWFQSYDQTNPDTLSQKITLLWKKLLNQGEINSFVRIITTVEEKSLSDSRETIFKFIRAFYPVFLEYIKNSQIDNSSNS